MSHNGHPNQKLIAELYVDHNHQMSLTTKKHFKMASQLIRLMFSHRLKKEEPKLSTYQHEPSRHLKVVDAVEAMSNIQRLLSYFNSFTRARSRTISSSYCRTLLTIKDDHNALAYTASSKTNSVCMHCQN